MTHGHFLPPGKRREGGKSSLLNSVRHLVTKGVLAAISLAALISSLLLVQSAPLAFASQMRPTGQAVPAIQSLPFKDTSYYMSPDRNKHAESLGKSQGKADAKHGQSSVVILDFGGQVSNGSGTVMIGNVFISNRQIRDVTERFAKGYVEGVNTQGPHFKSALLLGIGTNNSASDVSVSGGKTWARNVKEVESYVAHRYFLRVIVMGANDIESWCGSPPGAACRSFAAAKAWVQGFVSVDGHNYLNFGSADNCSTNTSSGGSCPGTGWTQYDYWYISRQAHGVIPQIYHTAWAEQWEMISLYGVLHQHNKRVSFIGPLTTPGFIAQRPAWDALWGALHQHKSTAQRFIASLEIVR